MLNMHPSIVRAAARRFSYSKHTTALFPLALRVHPGETPAQFIVHGMIDFLTGESPRARALRANVVFKIVPMLNPDGRSLRTAPPCARMQETDA